ncbi:hypothetical protein [Pseudalkalibacillus decolorationis]|uniref:hypothetical protein n=1 Tax=Pseudalkalibacillus decolorationis TaxID=163879 RepID=UPI00214922DE|nr:hypothetical protein [Pseudalkalibacillus decolorationis]
MNLNVFIPQIENLPYKQKYLKSDLLTASFLIEKKENIEIYYAAHNEYVNRKARILIVGITPGWFQMERSIRLTRKLLLQHTAKEELIKEVKRECRFAGSMRKNLIEMLDVLNLSMYFDIDSSADLFNKKDTLLHTVSLIKFPVFVKGKNYTGHTPQITNSELFMKYVHQTYETDINPLDAPLIIPLGKAVEQVLQRFVKCGWIQEQQCLFGFPHPSGANGHRLKQLNHHKAELIKKVQNYNLRYKSK